MSTDIGSAEAKKLYPRLARNFGPDALIQASMDRLNLSERAFANRLAEALYALIREKLNKTDWEIFARVLSARHIGQLNRSTWPKFIDIAEKCLGGASCIELSRVLAECLATSVAPSAILSFNAEPILYALLNARAAVLRWGPTERPAPTDVLDLVTHSISNRKPGRLPYCFCHGLLPVPDSRRSSSAVDKLVFSESTYLQLANTTFAWQSATFLHLCLSRSLVFFGVSLSDPNMRRWLAWVHANRVSEIASLHNSTGPSTSHYWINRAPAETAEKRWIESTVAHLGVRLVWIDSWEEGPKALRRMVGL
jgi:hypothetical protein